MTSREARFLLYQLQFHQSAVISFRDSGQRIAEITRFINTGGQELFQNHHLIRRMFYIHDYENMAKWLEIVPRDIVKIDLV